MGTGEVRRDQVESNIYRRRLRTYSMRETEMVCVYLILSYLILSSAPFSFPPFHRVWEW